MANEELFHLFHHLIADGFLVEFTKNNRTSLLVDFSGRHARSSLLTGPVGRSVFANQTQSMPETNRNVQNSLINKLSRMGFTARRRTAANGTTAFLIFYLHPCEENITTAIYETIILPCFRSLHKGILGENLFLVAMNHPSVKHQFSSVRNREMFENMRAGFGSRPVGPFRRIN